MGGRNEEVIGRGMERVTGKEQWEGCMEGGDRGRKVAKERKVRNDGGRKRGWCVLLSLQSYITCEGLYSVISVAIATRSF